MVVLCRAWQEHIAGINSIQAFVLLCSHSHAAGPCWSTLGNEDLL